MNLLMLSSPNYDNKNDIRTLWLDSWGRLKIIMKTKKPKNIPDMFDTLIVNQPIWIEK